MQRISEAIIDYKDFTYEEIDNHYFSNTKRYRFTKPMKIEFKDGSVVDDKLSIDISGITKNNEIYLYAFQCVRLHLHNKFPKLPYCYILELERQYLPTRSNPEKHSKSKMKKFLDKVNLDELIKNNEFYSI